MGGLVGTFGVPGVSVGCPGYTEGAGGAPGHTWGVCRVLWGVMGVSSIHVGCWRCPLTPALLLQVGVPGGVPADVKTEATTAEGRVQALQREVQGVTSIMTQNVERILARGENLEQLHSKSQDLEATVRRGTGSPGWAWGQQGGHRVTRVGRRSPG